MTSNPKREWEHMLFTDSLREPNKSYEVLQLLIQKPTLSYKEISVKMGIPYNTLTKWSVKYYYKERLQAYQEDLTNSLFTAIINHKIKLINSMTDRLDNETKILSNDLTVLAMHQEKLIKLEMDGGEVSPKQWKEYLKLRGAYFKDKLQLVKASKELDNIIADAVEIEDIPTDEVPPGIKSFITALDINRERYRDKVKTTEIPSVSVEVV